MAKRLIVVLAAASVSLGAGALVLPARAVVCTPVVTSRGPIPLTAAQVAVAGDTISGPVDATGCDIGVYVPSGVPGVTITNAQVHDADQFGVFNDGGSATVDHSHVYNTGNHTGGAFTPNGVQTGLDVIYVQNGANGATGEIRNSTIDQYQKGGIELDGANSRASIHDNVVTGLGMIDYTAQNGIQISRGATPVPLPTGNTVTNNLYLQGVTPPPAVATGIFVYLANVTGRDVGQISAHNSVHNNSADIYYYPS